MSGQLLFYLANFRRMYGGFFQPLANRHALSQLEIGILLFLHNNPTHNTARDIATMRGYAKSNLSTGIDTLRTRGLVSTSEDPTNRKLHRLHLTAVAKPVVKELSLRQKRCFTGMLKGFSHAERQTLWQFLDRIDDNILAMMEHTSRKE